MASTDHRPVAGDPIRDALRAIPVAAPLDDWSPTMARHRRRRRRQRAATVGASALAVLLVAAVVVGLADGDDALPVQAGDPTTTTVAPSEVDATDVDAADVSAVTWEPVVEDPRFVLSPAGPYVDGQEVTIDGPDELFDPNDVPQLCAIVDGREACDPLWSSNIPFDVIRGNGAGVVVPLRRWVFLPTGWHDCGDLEVTCRIVQHGQDGANRATAPLAFAGEPREAGVPRPLAVGDGGVVSGPLHDPGPPTVPIGPAARLLTDQPLDDPDPGSAATRVVGVEICRFLPAPTVPTSSILPADCEPIATFTEVGPRPFDATAAVPRALFGFAGWHDCLDGTCFVTARRGAAQDGQRLLAGGIAAAGLVRFAPDVPGRPRPRLVVEPPGPYQDDQVVTVTGIGFAAGTEVRLGQCNAGDPAGGTDPWGRPWEDCRYAGPLSIPVDDEGTFTVEVPMIRQHLVMGIPGSGIDCALEPAGTCYLGYTPGKGYAEPMASVPLTFTP